MSSDARSLLPLLSALTITLLCATAAHAMDCAECTAYSSCGETCTYCNGAEHPDGSCSRVATSTCGDFGFGACIQEGCTPNYVEVSRELRGTYGEGDLFTCQHHLVEWVTRHDVNQCNTDPAYWDTSVCEDHIDAEKWQGWRPDCCNGYDSEGNPDSRFTCNHWHSC